MASDPAQLRDLAAFVKALQQQAGYTTAAAWARDAGFPSTNLSKVRNGTASISGVNLVRLIRAAAARIGEEKIAFALRSAEPSPELVEVVAQLATVVARLNELLERPPNAQGHGQGP